MYEKNAFFQTAFKYDSNIFFHVVLKKFVEKFEYLGKSSKIDLISQLIIDILQLF